MLLTISVFSDQKFDGKIYKTKELIEIIKFQKVTLREYVKDYHNFWYDTCKTYKMLDNDVSLRIADIEINLKFDVCNYTLNYSKLNYTHKAVRCYLKKKKFLDCLKDTNVLLVALGLEVKK